MQQTQKRPGNGTVRTTDDTCHRVRGDGLKPDVQFCYDLELPDGFTPVNQDGEIAEFFLWPIAKVAEVVSETREFKFNCNLVIIDFLLRHGLIDPHHPDYLDIAKGLRQ